LPPKIVKVGAMTPTALDHVKVLLVDDAEFVRDLVARMLRRFGITQIVTAARGEEAVATAKAGQFDLVICDIGLPDTNGLEVVKRIHKTHPALPCVMLTGATERATVLAARAAGAVAYLVKPIAPRDLEAKIRAVLAQRVVAL
jgi:DNA-binding response OmpR family regulator